MSESLKIKGHVLLQLVNPDGSVAEERETHNLITTVGAQHYAQAISKVYNTGLTITNDFDTLALGLTGGDAPAVGSNMSNVNVAAADGVQVADSGYPKLNDDDTDNTGRGTFVMSWRATFAAGDYTQNNIDRVAITVNGATFNGSAALLSYATFTALNKGAGQALKVFVNHTVQAG